jgi:hypothetical protein
MEFSGAGGRRIVLLVGALVALTALVALASREFDLMRRDPPAPQPAAGKHAATRIEFDRFSARHERNDTESRLSVSLRLRNTGVEPETCYVFVVARNDRVTPKLWAIWPPQEPGASITAGGHFHGATPATGHAVVLADDWLRVTATMAETKTSAFDTVVVYVVGEDGRILLTRPFHV